MMITQATMGCGASELDTGKDSRETDDDEAIEVQNFIDRFSTIRKLSPTDVKINFQL